MIAPRGDIIADASVGEETIVTASVSVETVLQSKAYCDVGGHYSRPDVLQLHINRRPLARLVESDSVDRSVVTADTHGTRWDSPHNHEQEAENTAEGKGALCPPNSI